MSCRTLYDEESIGVTRTALAGRENGFRKARERLSQGARTAFASHENGSRRQRERLSKGAKAVRNSDALGSHWQREPFAPKHGLIDCFDRPV